MLHRGSQHVVVGAIVPAAGKNAQQEGRDRIAAKRIRRVVDLLREGFGGLKTEWIADVLIVVNHQAEVQTRVNRMPVDDLRDVRIERESVGVVKAVIASQGLIVIELGASEQVWNRDLADQRRWERKLRGRVAYIGISTRAFDVAIKRYAEVGDQGRLYRP